jgi:glycerate kinase
MRLIAPTAFKGTLTPLEVARRLASPGDRLLPLSDGGDGFLECLQLALGGKLQSHPAADPLGRIRAVPYLELPDGSIAIESAKVIGMAGLDRLDPVRASSLGLWHLLSVTRQAPRLWIGLGGTATMDGGRDWPPLALPPTTVFCDVTTDLLDAPRIYGPQKGASPADILPLTERLRDLGLPRGPRTGAAGGLGGKLLSLGARLVDGAEAILDVVHFAEACAGCESVVTGEGRLDASSLEGKLPVVVARRARALGLQVIGHFGSQGPAWEQAAHLFDEIRFGLAPPNPSP